MFSGYFIGKGSNLLGVLVPPHWWVSSLLVRISASGFYYQVEIRRRQDKNNRRGTRRLKSVNPFTIIYPENIPTLIPSKLVRNRKRGYSSNTQPADSPMATSPIYTGTPLASMVHSARPAPSPFHCGPLSAVVLAVWRCDDSFFFACEQTEAFICRCLPVGCSFAQSCAFCLASLLLPFFCF